MFAFEHNNGQTYEQALKLWNRSFPRWAYKGPDRNKHFGRDARQAYERVTGEELAWKVPRGRPRTRS